MPLSHGEWTGPAVAHARLVARLRERGHSLKQIKRATREGRLAFGYIEDLFPEPRNRVTLEEAAAETGLEVDLIKRIWVALGFPGGQLERVTDDDLQALRHIASVLAAGFPLVAFLQVVRVYGQALRQVADAEARLFHIYIHEPLMQTGVPGLEIAEEMQDLARDILPIASPLMDYLHQRYLRHFVEQDVIGHMDTDLESPEELGRVRVVIAFVDLAGFTRYTEEEGEEEALDTVDRFIESVEATLPDDARVVKLLGDEAMVVASDPVALTDWAVGFSSLFDERPRPRIGLHYGDAIYRDGDYFGRDVNLAARVTARSLGGEVLVTESVREAADEQNPHLDFQAIGKVQLKGFTEPILLYQIVPRED